MKKHLTAGRIAFYLLYLCAACAMVFGVTYARYSSRVTGSATASAAAMTLNSTVDLSGQLKGISPGEEKTISFQVTNKTDTVISEVAQDYSITLRTTGNIPLLYSLSVADSAGPGSRVSTEAGTEALDGIYRTVTWSGGSLPYAAGGVTHTYTLTAKWDTTDSSNAQIFYINEIDAVSLRVDAVQAAPQQAP